MEENTLIQIYQGINWEIQFIWDIQNETIWWNLNQIAQLFWVQKPAISKHIKNIFSTWELTKWWVVSILETTATDGKKYQVEYYNLDMIIAIGYRVNSQQATAFRKWATQVLRQYLLNGFALNQKRLQEKGLKEFEQALNLIKKNLNNQLSVQETQGLLSIISHYAESWILLQKYDEGELKLPTTNKKKSQTFSYEEACAAIEAMKQALQPKGEVSSTFWEERNDGLKGIIGQVYQSFDGQELYPSIEEKAAALLYFTIKNHPFVDGNKKIGALLFIVFLAKNQLLYTFKGKKRIDDATLTALTLLIASSEASEKTMLLKLIAHFLQD